MASLTHSLFCPQNRADCRCDAAVSAAGGRFRHRAAAVADGFFQAGEKIFSAALQLSQAAARAGGFPAAARSGAMGRFPRGGFPRMRGGCADRSRIGSARARVVRLLGPAATTRSGAGAAGGGFGARARRSGCGHSRKDRRRPSVNTGANPQLRLAHTPADGLPTLAGFIPTVGILPIFAQVASNREIWA